MPASRNPAERLARMMPKEADRALERLLRLAQAELTSIELQAASERLARQLARVLRRLEQGPPESAALTRELRDVRRSARAWFDTAIDVGRDAIRNPVRREPLERIAISPTPPDDLPRPRAAGRGGRRPRASAPAPSGRRRGSVRARRPRAR